MDFTKYENDVYKNIDRDNMMKIIYFLKSKGCFFIKEMLEDYLDLFSFNYLEFVEIFNKLDNKYNHNLINSIHNDMNILEEFYLNEK